MVETRGGRRFALLFFIASFLVLALGRWLNPVDHVALSIAAPFESAISTAATSVGDIVSGIFEGPKLRSENATLRRQMATLLRENIALQEQRRENQILQRMLRFENLNPHLDLLGARVIGSDSNSSLAPYLIINRGTRDGLRKGMTV